MLFCQFQCLAHHARSLFGGWCQDNLRPQKTHQLAAFDAEALSHGNHQRIALLCADHGKSDTGIATGGLDNGLAGFQGAGFFRGLDHTQRQPVLDRSQWVEGFNLDEQIDAFGREFVDPHDRRIADRSENIFIFTGHDCQSPQISMIFACVHIVLSTLPRKRIVAKLCRCSLRSYRHSRRYCGPLSISPTDRPALLQYRCG